MSTGMGFDASKGDLKLDQLVSGLIYVPRDAYSGHSVIVVGEDGVAKDQNGVEPKNSPYRILKPGDAEKLVLGLEKQALHRTTLVEFIKANLPKKDS